MTMPNLLLSCRDGPPTGQCSLQPLRQQRHRQSYRPLNQHQRRPRPRPRPRPARRGRKRTSITISLTTTIYFPHQQPKRRCLWWPHLLLWRRQQLQLQPQSLYKHRRRFNAKTRLHSPHRRHHQLHLLLRPRRPQLTVHLMIFLVTCFQVSHRFFFFSFLPLFLKKNPRFYWQHRQSLSHNQLLL